MNTVVLCGRLTADPQVRYTQDNEPMAIGSYTLAVDRRAKKDGKSEADFIRCIGFGKTGEFIEKYLSKGMKILIRGHIQTGSYEDKDGKKVYTTDVIVDEHEFVEKKEQTEAKSDFMDIPEGVESDGLPWN